MYIYNIHICIYNIHICIYILYTYTHTHIYNTYTNIYIYINMRMFIYVCCLKCPLLVEGLVNVNKVRNESRNFSPLA